MNSFWRSFFGFAEDDNPSETYEHAVGRARHYLEEDDYESACRILRYAERNKHAEAMYLYAWCYWRGCGVAEDAAHAVDLWKKSAALGYQPAIARCDEIKDFIATL
jgi:TPR repeat protein